MAQINAGMPQVDEGLELIKHLPQLPSIIRYHDHVANCYRVIKDFRESSYFSIILGRTRNYELDSFGNSPTIFRHIIVNLFSKVSPSTVATALSVLKKCKITTQFVRAALTMTPLQMRDWWAEHCSMQLTERQCGAFKAVLRSLCDLMVGFWNPSYVEFVSRLPTRPKNRYNILDSGDCFIPAEHQALIVRWIDDFCRAVEIESGKIEDIAISKACGLIACYQFGFRPIQIGSIKMADVKIRDGRVYLRVLMAKQGNTPQKHVVRKIKSEWCSPWIELFNRRGRIPTRTLVDPLSFFVLSGERISFWVTRLVNEITGDNWTPNDFRHTASQRLADSGASREQIQDFLMHATDGAASVYFGASASQAEKVNRAMGLSSVYREVHEIAQRGLISRHELEEAPEDQQIGGVVHGLPIAGIGACCVGQSVCPKNPIFSCYGCMDFLPLNERKIHEEVAAGLRSVVREFYTNASDTHDSPAYGQLRSAIDDVNGVIQVVEARKAGEQ